MQKVRNLFLRAYIRCKSAASPKNRKNLRCKAAYHRVNCRRRVCCRYVWHNINIVCPTSDLAEEIAMQDLSTMAIAAGINELHDTNELLNKFVTVRLLGLPIARIWVKYVWMHVRSTGNMSKLRHNSASFLLAAGMELLGSAVIL